MPMPSVACYVCGYTANHTEAEGLSFHYISKKLSRRHIVDKWLEFLLLPPTNVWPDQTWKYIRLCSIHFKEEDFCGRQVCLRKVLQDNAVPTRNPPNNPGRYGVLFSQEGEINTVTLDISPSSVEQEEMITADIAPSTDEQDEMITADIAPLTDEQDEMITADISSSTDEQEEIITADISPSTDEQEEMITADISPSTDEQEEMITANISLSADEQEEIITEPFTLKLDDSSSDLEITEEDCTDPVSIDHDYFNIEKQEHGDSKKDLNDLSRQLMLQDVRKNLCRLCGQRGTLLKPIFDPSSIEMNDISISAKIHMHLPFKVNVDDTLPCHICVDCSVGLNRWHDLYVTCVAADAVLKKTFGGDILMSSQGDWNHSANSDEDLTNSCDSETDPLVDAGSHEDIAKLNIEYDINSLDEEQNEILCSVCGMNTPSKSPKEDDLFIKEFESFYSKIHTERFKCNYCDELFPTSQTKKEHQKYCKELSTICEICGRKMSRKNLLKHKYACHHFLLRVCDKCGKCFNNTHLLNQHFNRMHEQDVIPRFCCNLCCVAFAKKENFVNHQKKHEKGKIKAGYQIKERLGVYICPVCNGTYNNALSLVVHLTSKREMKCPSCLKPLPNEKMLLVHDCCKFKCRYCPRAFSLKMDWVVHERLHTGEKPIKCRMCDKSFRSFHLRYNHELTHAPLHQCPICIKKFRRKSMFEDHLLWHQGNVFVCPICRKGFSTRVYVSKHIQNCHKSCKVKVE